MISVKEEDRDSLRFLWLKSVEKGLSEMVAYRFCRLIFGLKPSPAVLVATIKHHISQYSTSEPVATKVLENDLYVDDLATEADSEEKTISLYKSTKEVMAKGGFNLRKWYSNSSRVRQCISECDNDGVVVEKEVTASDMLCKESLPVKLTEDDTSYAKVSVNPLSSNETSEMKVLGVSWNFVNDNFKYSIQDLVTFAKLLPVTNGSVLKMSARIFDPLRLITPFSINLKIFFQELCLDATDWDAEFSDSFKNKWDKFILQLPALSDITVTRNCFPANKKGQVIELHGFSDACTKTCAAAIYVRVVDENVVHVMLLCAKSRVAPVKPQSVPRLELLGAVLLARLMDSVLKALAGIVSIDDVYYWTDSITVMCSIRNQRQWKQYVMRRVEEIRKLSQANKWNHCPGVCNPADLPTRGVQADQLSNNLLWWRGPEFINSQEVQIPCPDVCEESPLKEESVLQEEVKISREITHIFLLPKREIATTCRTLAKVMNCNDFSSLQRLCRVTCYVYRFIRNIRCRVARNTDVLPKNRILTVEEMNDAKNSWIRTVQSSVFSKEFECINTRCDSNYVRQFSLYVDECGLLRCKGRIGHANLPSETTNPVLLPTHHHLTDLVIKEVHSKMMHAGVASTLSALRDNYWIPRGREVVKCFIRRCVVCTKYAGKPFPLFTRPSLPEVCVDDGPPWTNTGVDYAGPLYVMKKKTP